MNKTNKKTIKFKTMRYIKRGYIILILLLLSISISSAATSQSPYSGTPRSIPGTIQAENFDKGGEGIAYHDLDSVNQGGQYRPTDGVDIQSTTDTTSGYNVGWIRSGEWLEYTTTVSTTGTYTIETRVASNGNGGTFHIEFNGIDKTGPMTIPNTGGWQNWQTLSKTVTLNLGQQVMKIVMDTNGPTGDVGNLNYIRIASSTSTPSPSPTVTPTPTNTPASTLTVTSVSTLTVTPTPTQSPIVSGAFYVAKNGNDVNPGTESSPWKTIQKAANTLTAGQTVYVKEGTYNEQITIKNSGNTGKWITFLPYSGQTVTIEGTGITIGNYYGLVNILGKNYIKFSGFRVINSDGVGIFVESPFNYITIENNYISHSRSSGIQALNSGTNIIINGNQIVNSQYNGQVNHETITVANGVNGFVISNNIISGSRTEGIDVKNGVQNGEIYGNDVSGTNNVGIYLDAWSTNSGNIKIYKNKVHNQVPTDSNSDATGIMIGSEQGGSLNTVSIFNNIVYNNPGDGINIGWYSKASVDNVKIVDNTVYNNGGGVSWTTGGIQLNYAGMTNVIVQNNIVSQNKGFQIRTTVPSQTTVTNNLIYGFRSYSSETRGTNYIESDPKLVNLPSDFHLQSSSPAIDKGVSTNAPSSDFDGKPRPTGAGYDIGAFEYSP